VFTALYLLSPCIKQICSVFKGLKFKHSFPQFLLISKLMFQISNRNVCQEILLRSNRFRDALRNCRLGQFRDTSQSPQLTLCRADVANGLCHAGRMNVRSHWPPRPSLRPS
jgi:hypothetical protein